MENLTKLEQLKCLLYSFRTFENSDREATCWCDRSAEYGCRNPICAIAAKILSGWTKEAIW